MFVSGSAYIAGRQTEDTGATPGLKEQSPAVGMSSPMNPPNGRASASKQDEPNREEDASQVVAANGKPTTVQVGKPSTACAMGVADFTTLTPPRHFLLTLTGRQGRLKPRRAPEPATALSMLWGWRCTTAGTSGSGAFPGAT